MRPRSFPIALAALFFLSLSPSSASATPMVRETGIVAPVVQIWGGCGPYGHRGPLGGCRPGGQWGGGGWGPRRYAWGGYGYRGGYWRGGYRRGGVGGYRRGWRR